MSHGFPVTGSEGWSARPCARRSKRAGRRKPMSAQWFATLKDAQSAVEFLAGAVRMLTGQRHLVGRLNRCKIR